MSLLIWILDGMIVLQDLEKQFPPALLKAHQYEEGDDHVFARPHLASTLECAILLKNERFNFVMDRCWGDLRKLIDQQMMESHNQGPPFSTMQVLWLMFHIAAQMYELHPEKPPILHNDLKAANVLVERSLEIDEPRSHEKGMYKVVVADFECSVGVVGTGLCRAPEILQQLKKQLKSRVVMSKCDIYSYGMTCYELVIGRIPFTEYEDHPLKGCEFILNGERLELPPNLESVVREIITSCWHEKGLVLKTFWVNWDQM